MGNDLAVDRYTRDLEMHFYFKIHMSISIFKFEPFLFLPPPPPDPKSDGKLKIKRPRPYIVQEPTKQTSRQQTISNSELQYTHTFLQ